MSTQANARPIIIKRKKVVKGGGHHGGAWKVAYADFVTAMMAFFMLMWLLNATTESQRKGLADYFSPTIAINRVSGGGDGAFGGDSVFSQETLPQNGTGATAQRPTEQNQARGESGSADAEAQGEVLKSLNAELVGRGGESQVMENALEHIITRVTDEGLVIEMFATPGRPLFEPGTQKPTEFLEILVYNVALRRHRFVQLSSDRVAWVRLCEYNLGLVVGFWWLAVSASHTKTRMPPPGL